MKISNNEKKFTRYAWFTLVYNVFVILLGAFVRATGSGAGCGGHWPSCNGVIIPQAPAVETIIEYTHRLSSGLSAIFVLILVVAAFRVYPKGNRIRKSASLSFVFILTEAFFGAGLVIFGLVADNDSVARAVVIVLHLINTFLLLGFLTITARWARLGPPGRLTVSVPFGGAILTGGVLVFLLGATGTITALGDTLFPATSLAEGMRQDFTSTGSFLLKLRIYHPILAIITGSYLVLISWLIRRKYQDGLTQRMTTLMPGLVAVQVLLGFINLGLLAPIWMQLVHLAMTDAIWVTYVLLGEMVLGGRMVIESRTDQTVHDRINGSTAQHSNAKVD